MTKAIETMNEEQTEAVVVAAIDADMRAGIGKPTPERINNRPLFTQKVDMEPYGYNELERILKLAFQQASTGKGRERHAFSPAGIFMPWDQQPILANARQIGPGGPAMQVMKKAGESVTMAGNKNFAGAKAEALGAIVYAAALYKLYEEMEQARA